MSEHDSHCDCDVFAEGDWVESRLNPQVFGIVTGTHNFGQFYTVQLAGSLGYQVFSAVTLCHHYLEELPANEVEPATEDNVIRVDFTKGRKIEPDTKTEGAA